MRAMIIAAALAALPMPALAPATDANVIPGITPGSGPPCWPRAEVVEDLRRDFGETPVAQGLSAAGNLMEVFASPEGKTWTIVMTNPRGFSCLVAVGHNLAVLAQLVKGQGI